MTAIADDALPTLDNCAREPIHIPGLLQSHGALLAFDGHGTVTHATSNTRAWLGETAPGLHERLLASHLEGNAAIHAAVREANDPHHEEGLAWNQEVRLNGRRFDLVTHRFGGATIVEFETRADAPDGNDGFAVKAYRAMNRLKRHESIDQLLEIAVVAVRELTGFDRVMAYRFHDDGSGEIAAEARADALEPFRGRRYPAGDIPAQARRLYLINTLRLIADVDAVPLAVLATSAQLPLDMSHCVLRSVSPIHLEYLRNIGVGASMSISIVVNGRLWGMIACHHRAPRQVPYGTRIACDVLAQTLAAQVQSLLARRQASDVAQASALRGKLIEAVLHAEDAGAALGSMSTLIGAAFSADVVVVAEEDKLVVDGPLSREHATRIVAWLNARKAPLHEVLIAQSIEDMPSDIGDGPRRWCGLLAMRYDELAGGWLVLLRREQVETITWGDRPDKVYPSGPLGARLTPQGSLAVWREDVLGRCIPWTAADHELARHLVDELARASATRMAELNRARSQLLAMLGHDLRDPLHSIAMATKVFERTADAVAPEATRVMQRIRSSTNRMSRLIGQVLDASRLQNGLGLPMQLRPLDMSALVGEIVTEARLSYPDVTILLDAPPGLRAMADADRMAQLLGNLIGNARQHGTPGEPVIVQMLVQGPDLFIEVANSGEAIAAELMPVLFSAFHRVTVPSDRNRTGLGLGLHIAQAVARGHSGGISYKHANQYVIFTLRFPVGRMPEGGR